MKPANLFENHALIKVMGAGGAGCNAVNRMIQEGVQGVHFVAMNTDAQALSTSLAPRKIKLGIASTHQLRHLAFTWVSRGGSLDEAAWNRAREFEDK